MGNRASRIAPEFRLADWQVSRKRGRRENDILANKDTRGNLVNHLVQNPLPMSLFVEAGFLNPALQNAIFDVIGHPKPEEIISPVQMITADEESDEDSDADSEQDEGDEIEAMGKKQLAAELLLSTALRNRSKKVYVFFAVTLSILALSVGLHQQMWQVLSAMGLLYSKRWTRALAIECGVKIESSVLEGQSDDIGCEIVDNIQYRRFQTWIHEETDTQTANGEFKLCVNMCSVPIVSGPIPGLVRGESLILLT
jgi:hypothetical protein